MVKNTNNAFSSIQMEDYIYHLPEESIAKHPLPQRDSSRLLLYQKGEIQHEKFRNIADFLPEKSCMFFNNTKVIPARILFRKATGAQIEIFLLQPSAPSTIISEVLSQTSRCSWQCMIGNQKRWKEGQELERFIPCNGQEVKIVAVLENKESGEVSFSWEAENVSFAELVEAAGEVPLPPYLNRKAEESDKPRYQTVYSKAEGAVAAPTAGLHFTPEVLQELENKGTTIDYLTLHVSAGTFRPIKDKVEDHPMHREQLIINRQNLENLIYKKGKVIAVGTTSMRTLESLYWYGVKLMNDPEASFFITKEEAYSNAEEALPDAETAFREVLKRMDDLQKDEIWGETEIFIIPSYKFRVCEGLVTNFHQPESTLILLVAAFIGSDWKRLYHEALTRNYRFLSYGDSSLLLPS